jgi:cell division protein FtsB|tara:strand:+ start:608 stop:835 length:228 start_codon:yes stop_codon:yes gene_type:complete
MREDGVIEIVDVEELATELSMLAMKIETLEQRNKYLENHINTLKDFTTYACQVWPEFDAVAVAFETKRKLTGERG